MNFDVNISFYPCIQKYKHIIDKYPYHMPNTYTSCGCGSSVPTLNQYLELPKYIPTTILCVEESTNGQNYRYYSTTEFIDKYREILDLSTVFDYLINKEVY